MSRICWRRSIVSATCWTSIYKKFRIENYKLRIKVFLKSVTIFLVLLLLVVGGCEHVGVEQSSSKCDENLKGLGVYNGFSPVEINVLPLTKIETGDKGSAVIRAYVSLTDRFSSQIKAPVVFRFELYEKISRSQEPKGKRIVIWPDFNLCGPGDNNRHWEDFLRAYKFDLDFQHQKNQHYVLQVTCLCPSGKRLAAETELEAQ